MKQLSPWSALIENKSLFVFKGSSHFHHHHQGGTSLTCVQSIHLSTRLHLFNPALVSKDSCQPHERDLPRHPQPTFISPSLRAALGAESFAQFTSHLLVAHITAKKTEAQRSVGNRPSQKSEEPGLEVRSPMSRGQTGCPMPVLEGHLWTMCPAQAFLNPDCLYHVVLLLSHKSDPDFLFSGQPRLNTEWLLSDA